MKYCDVKSNKEHIINLIKWIYEEVISAGGDGDFLWYSRYYSVKDIYPLVEELNNTLNWKWKLKWLDDNSFILGESQESFLITNNEDLYKNAPIWQQGLLKY